jgi:ribosome-binding ATPase YchF (GTP1/OBG family)
MAIIGTSDLLTLKKTIYVANLAEAEINEPEENRHYMAVKTLADEEGSQLIPICAKLEADIAELDDPEEKAMFMEELGVNESGLDKLIRSSYALLGLISFLTAGSDECRAWTIKKGTKAPQAAGKIHTDFERGFIRAEVIAFNDMKDCGTMAAAKAKGLVRSEGKEYVMKDGDIVNFLFNV